MTVKLVNKAACKVGSNQESLTDYLLGMIAPVRKVQKAVADANAKLKQAKAAYTEVVTPVLGRAGMETPPEKEVVITDTTGHVLRVSKEGAVRRVLSPKEVYLLLAQIDEDLPYKLMQFKLADLDAYLTPVQLEALVDKQHTGKRTVKVT